MTARLGVWGLVAALVPPMAEAFGGPLWLATLTPLSAAGLVTSGIGTLAASALVIRSLPAGFGPLKVAAFAGIPFGVIFVLGGAALLAPLSRLADVADRAGPFMLLLGILVVVSLVVGFLRGGRNEQ